MLKKENLTLCFAEDWLACTMISYRINILLQALILLQGRQLSRSWLIIIKRQRDLEVIHFNHLMQCNSHLILFRIDGVVGEMLNVVLSEHYLGYAYEELSEVSPNHHFLAYTMYDKDNGYFKLSVRNLNSGSLCSKPQADRVSNLAWAKDGQALLYVVTDEKMRPYR